MSSGFAQPPLASVLVAGQEPVPGFKLEVRLGGGGFGEVWRARSRMGFEVALKFVRLDNDKSAFEMRALGVIQRIHHPNLLTPFDAWQIEDYLVLGMELADRTLFSRFQEAVKDGYIGIPREELVEYFREAAKGIDYLNSYRHRINGLEDAGVQHRDIKPHNILMVGDGVKVADFGLARLLQGSIMSSTGLMTIQYAPPEFFEGRVSTQSDQYSLAITYCEMRGGRRPFVGATIEQMMHAHRELPPDLSMLSPEEHEVIAKALAKNPRDRWHTCRELVDALIACRPSTLPSGETAPRQDFPTISGPIHRPADPGLVQTTKTATVPIVAPAAETRLPTRIHNAAGMELVLIQPGAFQMGTPTDALERNPDETLHEVELTEYSYCGVFQVTQEQYERVTGSTPSWFCNLGKGRQRVENIDTRHFPVEQVSWDEAMEFCARLSAHVDEKAAGRLYRLPTEAEWEYICRAGSSASQAFCFGPTLSSRQANFNGARPAGSAPIGPFLSRPTDVGSYPANAFGVHDMHGNVAEWCMDWYDRHYYKHSPRQNPPGPESSPQGCRVVRGGSWNSIGNGCRSAERNWSLPGTRSSDVGFRIVMVNKRPSAITA